MSEVKLTGIKNPAHICVEVDGKTLDLAQECKIENDEYGRLCFWVKFLCDKIDMDFYGTKKTIRNGDKVDAEPFS